MLVPTNKSKEKKYMKNCRVKSEISLDQYLKIQINMMKNISNVTQMTSYL